MARPRIGIYEKALPVIEDWQSRFAAAATAHFDFVEIAVDETDERMARLDWPAAVRTDVRSAAENAGLDIYNLILSAHRRYPLGSRSTTTRQKALDIMKKGIALACDLDIGVIQLSGYFVFYEEHEPESRARFLDGLAQCVQWAAEAGITLGLENMDGEDVVTMAEARAIVDEIDLPELKLYPDVGNLGGNGLDVCEELSHAPGYYVGIHLKDARPGVYRRVPFGDGIVPFTDAFRTLAGLGYDGPFLIEMWNDGAPDALGVVSQAREWIEARMMEAGLIETVH